METDSPENVISNLDSESCLTQNSGSIGDDRSEETLFISDVFFNYYFSLLFI